MSKKTEPTRQLLFNVEAIFAAVGGPRGMLEALEARDFPTPAYDAVCMWRVRQRIPYRWLATVLFAVMSASGKKLADLVFVIDGPQPKHRDSDKADAA